MRHLLAYMCTCIAGVILSGCAAVQIQSEGVEAIQSNKWDGRTGLHEYVQKQYGVYTTNDMCKVLGQPTLIDSRDGEILAYGWEHRQRTCPSTNLIVYEYQKCWFEITQFVAVFKKGVLRTSWSTDAATESSQHFFTTRPFYDALLLDYEFRRLSDVLDDALKNFAETHIGSEIRDARDALQSDIQELSDTSLDSLKSNLQELYTNSVELQE